ncbi:MAG: hypothetical protein KDK25_12945, partial [Leptospiraceae bacterium]|nr:hypothetical protein [Leptospiraceae bacterium]
NESLLGILFIGPPGAIDWTAARLNGISEVRSLVTMALSNSILYARLQGILGHLEEKVRERTRRLEETQAHLVQSEKMAMLGVMIAGIAHEINTPAGVIFGGSMNLEQNLEGVLDHVPWLLDRLGEERLKKLMHITLQQAREKIHVSGAFKKKKELQKELERRWPDQDVSRLVGHLVESGLYAEEQDLESERVRDILETYNELIAASASDLSSEGKEGSDAPSTGRLVDFLKLISSTGKNLSNIRGSIDSIVRIVRALKSYSHPGQKTYGAARVEEGLNNTMIILSSVWKGHVTVEKEFQDTPEVECDADELNQVWTNLLTNSWQAMRGQSDASLFVASHFAEDSAALLESLRKGKEGWDRIHFGQENASEATDASSAGEVATCAVVGEIRGPAVCITVRDNGPGIPAEHIEKIWDPFFTTKDQGEGSGLGLSIVRRIVEEHGGAIAVRTAPDAGTHFCVLLPLKQDEETIKKKEARNRDLAELKKTERGQSMPFKFR